jgi:hypothetical protein
MNYGHNSEALIKFSKKYGLAPAYVLSIGTTYSSKL